MARTSQVVSISAQPGELRDIDKARGLISRSKFLISGVTRLAELQAIADAGLAEYKQKSTRERVRNPSEIIAEASTAGHTLLRALEEIAKAAK